MSSAAVEYRRVQGGNADELIHLHTPLVRRIAWHLKARLPANVDVGDLLQAGMIGLLEAARNYLPARNSSFEAFAGIRIRGAMLDELRRNDWTPRSVYRRLRDVMDAIRRIEAETGCEASDVEVMRRLGISRAEYDQIMDDAGRSRVLSLSDGDDESGGIDIVDEHGPGPAALCADESRQQALADAIDGLPEREKWVMSLYYDDELNLKEIGQVLEVSESRVCQIHGQAMLRLRARLRDWR